MATTVPFTVFAPNKQTCVPSYACGILFVTQWGLHYAFFKFILSGQAGPGNMVQTNIFSLSGDQLGKKNTTNALPWETQKCEVARQRIL